MKIISATSVLVRLPFGSSGPDIIAGRSEKLINVLQIRIETEDGLVGWGEAFGHAVAPITQQAFDHLIAPLLIGRDATDIDSILRELHTALHLYGRNGVITFAISGVDIALWDLAGKRADLPLYRLLGAEPCESVPTYASLLRCGTRDLLESSCAAALSLGFQQVKLHEVEPALVKVARDALGADVRMMVDVNCPWTLEEARDKERAMRDFGIAWLEEPIFPPEDAHTLALLRRECTVPIAAGENVGSVHGFRAMFEASAIDIALPSVSKVGGVSGMLAVAALAKQYGVELQPHCAYFGSGYLATLHLCALFGNTSFELYFIQQPEPLFAPFDQITGGRARVPQGPGLGCDPDPELIARYSSNGC
ncbi:mandelate racemase/muconate lactonizing enzyme family protein [Paraburkholderia sp. RL17-337-BIB-A]|uniref:mandelate racemase/muconate lactonizing enzyme family protein n=1 Tax=Paraburkholderia sp. RL17-337-BIB-A TaxID=3031636 RepID=UPI0038BC65D7